MTLLLLEATEPEPRALPCAGGRAVAMSAVSPVGSVNEDAAAVVPIDAESGVLVVADGMGGAAAGQHAARLAVTTITESVAGVGGSEERLRTALLDGIESANRSILELGVGAATTLAAVEIAAGIARPYHVGDSLILVVGGRGRLKWRSVAHSPVGYGLEAGLLDETDALGHAERHLVSNVLGSTEMRIEIGPPIVMAPHDTVLVASDGLADNLHVDEIAHGLRERDLGRAVSSLAVAASRRMAEPTDAFAGKPDDLTIVGYRPGRTRGRPQGARSQPSTS